MALTPKQERFVSEYLIDLNASAAYKRAGYAAKGNSAEVSACRLLRNAQIEAEIARRSKKTADKYELTQELVIRTIVQELTFDPARLYDAEGRLLPIHELPEDVRMALTSVEFEQHGSKDAPVYVSKVKWAQRQGAREQAMKHIGMFLEDNKQKRGVEAMPDDALDKLIAQKARELGVTVH
jgi:phage terminase small subunit